MNDTERLTIICEKLKLEYTTVLFNAKFEGERLVTLNLSEYNADVEYGSIDVLPKDLFSGLDGLENLYLRRNSIKRVEHHHFDGLTNLKVLDISSNLITKLSMGIFDNLPNLEEVDFTHNKFLNKLDTDLFRFNHNLRTITLTALPIKIVPDGFLDQQPNIKHCAIQLNDLEYLPESLFHNCLQIEYININGITNIPKTLFRGLKRLKFLDLSQCRLNELPQGIFKDLISLTKLHLDKIQLIKLHEDVFVNLKNLVDLSLNGNNFPTLPPTIFHSLTKLEAISLDDGNLVALPTDIFAHSPKLDMLSIKRNQLKILQDRVFSNIKNISSLYLQDNLLEALPKSLLDLKELCRLTLAGNPVFDEFKSNHIPFVNVMPGSYPEEEKRVIQKFMDGELQNYFQSRDVVDRTS